MRYNFSSLQCFSSSRHCGTRLELRMTKLAQHCRFCKNETNESLNRQFLTKAGRARFSRSTDHVILREERKVPPTINLSRDLKLQLCLGRIALLSGLEHIRGNGHYFQAHWHLFLHSLINIIHKVLFIFKLKSHFKLQEYSFFYVNISHKEKKTTTPDHQQVNRILFRQGRHQRKT